MPTDFDIVAGRMRVAGRLTILTGAGVSAASGVPTFRGTGGLWKQFRAEELATAEAFARDPTLVWEWYTWRREVIRDCEPNAAHDVIARWSRRSGTAVVTQNVDDLHVRAGTRGLTRLHGSIWEVSCVAGCAPGRTPWRDESHIEALPRCRHCGGLARPAVVWFGERLRAADLDSAVESTACDVFLSVGTASVVHPAAGLIEQARHRGALIVEINPDSTPASSTAHVAIAAPAEEVLPAIERAIASG